MNQHSEHTPQVWELWKEMTQPTRKRSLLSIDQLAYRLRESPRMLYAWGEPNSRHRLPADVIVPATIELEDPLLLRQLCHQVGRVCFDLPTGQPMTGMAAEVLKEVGEALQALADATNPDGYGGTQCTEREARRVREEITQAIEALLAVQADVEERAGLSQETAA